MEKAKQQKIEMNVEDPTKGITIHEFLGHIGENMLGQRFVAAGMTLVRMEEVKGKQHVFTSVCGFGVPDQMGTLVVMLHGCRDTLLSMARDKEQAHPASVHEFKRGFAQLVLAMSEYFGQDFVQVVDDHVEDVSDGQG